MRLGDNSVNPDKFILEQREKPFLPRGLGKVGKDIFNPNSHEIA